MSQQPKSPAHQSTLAVPVAYVRWSHPCVASYPRTGAKLQRFFGLTMEKLEKVV